MTLSIIYPNIKLHSLGFANKVIYWWSYLFGWEFYATVFDKYSTFLHLLIYNAEFHKHPFLDPCHSYCISLICHRPKIVIYFFIQMIDVCLSEYKKSHWNTGLVSSRVSLTSSGDGASYLGFHTQLYFKYQVFLGLDNVFSYYNKVTRRNQSKVINKRNMSFVSLVQACAK